MTRATKLSFLSQAGLLVLLWFLSSALATVSLRWLKIQGLNWAISEVFVWIVLGLVVIVGLVVLLVVSDRAFDTRPEEPTHSQQGLEDS